MPLLSHAAGSRPLEFLAKPLRGRNFAAAGCICLFAGASYCMGYAILSGNSNDWLHALGWSIGAVIPWLIAFELLKRIELGKPAPIIWSWVVLMLLLTGIASLLLEALIDDLVWGDPRAPLGLAVLRRLPAVAIVLVLIAATRQSDRATMPSNEPIGALASHLVYVRAADNYLELHFANRMIMRRQTLASAERELTVLGFVRIHRSILVHPKHFVVATIAGKPHAVAENGQMLPFGSRYRDSIRHFVP